LGGETGRIGGSQKSPGAIFEHRVSGGPEGVADRDVRHKSSRPEQFFKDLQSFIAIIPV
jgi:hypothetical protein